MFKIITPERVVFSDEVEQVSINTREGEITVLPHHLPLVGLLVPGELRYKKNNTEHAIATSTGFVEVRADNSVVILADTAEHAGEIDLAKAQEAHDRATRLMSESRNKEAVDFSALSAKLEKELARLRVAKKYRNIKLPG